MADVLLYVVIENRICEYWFYSRELANALFGEEEIGLALIQNKLDQRVHICLLRIESNIYGPCNTNHLSSVTCYHNGTARKWREVSIIPGQCCAVGATEVCPIYKSIIHLEAHLASCVTSELKLSFKFRRRFLKRIRKLSPFEYVYCPSSGQFSKIFDGAIDIPYVVEIQPFYSKQKIDYAWYYRIQGQLIKRMHYDEALAWLSTLGGAYSSLGDYFESHAIIAGKISVKQMKIALELGDPLTVARCKLFFALSLMQQGQYTKSRAIIRQQLKFAKRLEVRDEKLVAMCRGLRSRVKFLINNSQNHRKTENRVNTVLKENG